MLAPSCTDSTNFNKCEHLNPSRVGRKSWHLAHCKTLRLGCGVSRTAWLYSVHRLLGACSATVSVCLSEHIRVTQNRRWTAKTESETETARQEHCTVRRRPQARAGPNGNSGRLEAVAWQSLYRLSLDTLHSVRTRNAVAAHLIPERNIGPKSGVGGGSNRLPSLATVNCKDQVQGKEKMAGAEGEEEGRRRGGREGGGRGEGEWLRGR